MGPGKITADGGGTSVPDQGRELLISGMPEGLTEEELGDLFGIHGNMAEVRVRRGPKGIFGLVTYEDAESAQTAIEHMDGHELLEAKLQVRHRQPGEAPWEPAKVPVPAQVLAAAPLRVQPAPVVDMSDRTGCDLVIFNLPGHWNNKDLLRLCELHGKVLNALVIKDRGPMQTYGLVQFVDRVRASIALTNLQGYRVDNGRLVVEAKTKNLKLQLAKVFGEQPPLARAPVATAGLGRVAPVAAAQAPMPPAPTGPTQTEHMEVPKQMIRLLIGKDGLTIRHISRESYCRIDVSREILETSNTRSVELTGAVEAIAKAKRLISLMLRSSQAIRPGDPNYDVVRVSQHICRTVIGHAGEMVTRIRKDSGARIELVKDDVDESCRLVVIAGPDECVEYARELVMDVVTKAEEREGLGPPGSESSNMRFEKVEVAEEYVGKLMGRGGESIQKISRDTGVKITSRRVGSGRLLHLSGDAEQIEEARRLIDEKINEGTNRQPPRRGEAERFVPVPANLIGNFIGRGGEHINKLSQATGCMVRVPQHSTDNERKVQLVGSQEAVNRASAAIQRFLENDSWDGIDEAADEQSLVSERIYVDEVALPRRAELWKASEDGLPGDTEIFIRGLPDSCRERDLWSHLCSLGASDVAEVLMLRRGGKSKGMAYIIFQRHESAALARSKLHGAAASVVAPPSTEDPPSGRLEAWFSESERCIKGRHGVYGYDVLGALLGSKGANMGKLQDETGLRKVIMTGAHMGSYGKVDNDPRLHLVVYYEKSEEANADKAYDAWSSLLSGLHAEFAQKRDGTFQRPARTPGAKDENADVAPVDEPAEDHAPQEGSGDDTEPPGDHDKSGPPDAAPELDDLDFGIAPEGEAQEEDADRRGAEGGRPGDEEDGRDGEEAGGELEPEVVSLMAVVREREGGREIQHEVLSGEYVEFGEHQGRLVYWKEPPDTGADEEAEAPAEVYLYYLDPTAGDEAPCAGWRLGSAIGGEEVWARCPGEERTPPEEGWEIVLPDTEGLELFMVPGQEAGAEAGRDAATGDAADGTARKRRRRRRERPHRHERDRLAAAGPRPGTGPASPPPPQDWSRGGYGQAPPTQLPRPWIALSHGSAVYYVNQETGERSWYPPPASAWAGSPGQSASSAVRRERTRRRRSRSVRRAGGGGAAGPGASAGGRAHGGAPVPSQAAHLRGSAQGGR